MRAARSSESGLWKVSAGSPEGGVSRCVSAEVMGADGTERGGRGRMVFLPRECSARGTGAGPPAGTGSPAPYVPQLSPASAGAACRTRLLRCATTVRAAAAPPMSAAGTIQWRLSA